MEKKQIQVNGNSIVCWHFYLNVFNFSKQNMLFIDFSSITLIVFSSHWAARILGSRHQQRWKRPRKGGNASHTQKSAHKDQALGRLLSKPCGCVNFKSQASWEKIEAHFWYSSLVGSEISMKKVSHALFAKIFVHSKLPQFIFLQRILICFKKYLILT